MTDIRDFNDAKRLIPIPEFLSALGHTHDPAKSRGEDYWYCSPLRKESEPSFHVRMGDKGFWYWKDFGNGGGGSIIDLAMQLQSISRPGDALNWLRNWYLGNVDQIQITPRPKMSRKEEGPTFSLGKVRDLQVENLYDQSLLHYCFERGIRPELASQYLKRVQFRNNRKKKNYYAVGIENRAGGYDVRNAGFKGCIGSKKDITLITDTADSASILIFEGMFDFLSYLQMSASQELHHPTIVLNSTELIGTAIQWLQNNQHQPNLFEQILTFMDNDATGKKATQRIMDAFKATNIRIETMNHLYKDHIDLNAHLVANKTTAAQTRLEIGEGSG